MKIRIPSLAPTIASFLATGAALAQDFPQGAEGSTPPPAQGGPEVPDSAPDPALDAARDDVRFVLAGGYAHFFDTDFDTGGGGIAVDRGFASVTMAANPTEDYGWSLGFDWEGSWYSFEGAGTLAAVAGGAPWSAVQSIVIAPGASFRLAERWNLRLTALVQFSGENDADAGDSATFGGIAAVGYSFSEELTLGAGVLATTRLEDDALVVPQLIVDWRPTQEFRISNFAGPEAFPGGAGLEAIWMPAERFELALGGRYTYRRFRLDDATPGPASGGVGTDEGLPIWLRATFRSNWGGRLDLVGGVQVAGEVALDDATGNELAKVDVEPAPFLGVFFSWRF